MADKTLSQRIKDAAAAAQESFWAKIVEHFPEIKTGDFPPDAMFDFDTAIDNAVRTWVLGNADFAYWQLLSPDGFSLDREDTIYATKDQAMEAMDLWIERYANQGYYFMGGGTRINLEDLKDHCTLLKNGEEYDINL